MNFINLLIPKNVNLPKVRLGINSDGGYVITEKAIEKCDALFTYGVGNEISFEVEFAKKYKKPVYMYDHTVNLENVSQIDENLFFEKEGLGFDENCDDFFNHLTKRKIDKNVLLKIDIEGNEFSFFEKTNLKEIGSKCVGLIIEIHGFNDYKVREVFSEIFGVLYKDFYLCHFHGNNYSPSFELDGEMIPCVAELSLIHKDLVEKCTDDIENYPVDGIDFPNANWLIEMSHEFINKKR